MEIGSPFDEPRKESRGEAYQRQASELAEWLRLKVGLNLTPKAVDALAVLLGALVSWGKSLRRK